MEDRIYTVMTYNVWNGLNDIDRMKNFHIFMNNINVDVLAYQELCGFTPKKLNDLARSYGHKNCVLLKKRGYPVGITSKHNIEVIKKKTFGFWHGFLHVKIKGIDHIVIHLSPKDEKFRYKEASKLLKYIENNCSENCIVLGDFNSSPILHETNDKQYKVFNFFSHNGFFDTIQNNELNHTYPTKINKDTDILKERIDFQLVSKSLLNKIVFAKIINNEINDLISDHYPVVVEYLLD